MLLLQAAAGFTLPYGPGYTLPLRSTLPICSELRPLSLLKNVEAAPTFTGGDQGEYAPGEFAAKRPRYCKYDVIRETLAASRERSYRQGRDGCCSKAADYLGGNEPPADSPWKRSEQTRD